MKRLFLFFFFIFASLSAIAQENGDAVWPPAMPAPVGETVKMPVVEKGLIRVASYSIMPETTMPEAPEMRWRQRREQVAHILVDCHIDAVGTQRALAWQLRQLMKDTPLRVASSETDTLCPAASSEAILYDTTRLELREWGQFRFVGQASGAEPRGCAWARLRTRKGRREFYLFSACMRTGVEAAMLADSVRRIAGAKPAVVAADLFALSYAPVVERVKGIPLNDAYSVAQLRAGAMGTYHGFRTLQPRRRYDYVFVSPRIAVERYDVVDEELRNLRPGSDHLPVVTDLKLSK